MSPSSSVRVVRRACLALLPALLLGGCASSRPAVVLTSSENPPVSMDAGKEAPASAPAQQVQSSGYGFSPEDPIKVGGGPDGEYEFLMHLRGPDGQVLKFERLGSCCAFESPSSPFGGGLLDMYQVTYEGLPSPVTLYLNMYERDEPRAPAGFRLD